MASCGIAVAPSLSDAVSTGRELDKSRVICFDPVGTRADAYSHNAHPTSCRRPVPNSHVVRDTAERRKKGLIQLNQDVRMDLSTIISPLSRSYHTVATETLTLPNYPKTLNYL